MTSFRWNWPTCTLGCFSGLKLVAVFEMIGILMQSNIPPFFEHNMRYFTYSAALCIQIYRFQSKWVA